MLEGRRQRRVVRDVRSDHSLFKFSCFIDNSAQLLRPPVLGCLPQNDRFFLFYIPSSSDRRVYIETLAFLINVLTFVSHMFFTLIHILLANNIDLKGFKVMPRFFFASRMIPSVYRCRGKASAFAALAGAISQAL